MNRIVATQVVVALLFSVFLAHSAPASLLFDDRTVAAGLANYDAQSGDGHGPGAVFADLDDDGYPDLYLMRAWGNANELYLNRDSNGERVFEKISDGAGAGDTGNATGAITADYDGDGDLDLYVLNYDQPNVLYENQLAQSGSLSFIDRTADTDPTPGVDDEHHGLATAFYEDIELDNSLTAAWSDIDRDGDLDLYVGNHNSFESDDGPPEGPASVPGRRDVLYLNNGDGTFDDATTQYDVTGYKSAEGTYETSEQRFSSTNAVVFADFNNDRWPDLFVSNKLGGPDDRDMLYINRARDGNGVWLGYDLVTYDLSPEFGGVTGGAMGADVGDYDNDGDMDIYVSDWSDLDDPADNGGNDLWVNQLQETGTLGFAHSEAMPGAYSWGVLFADFDNDGWQDMHVASEVEPDFLYHNTPGGFVDLASAAGVDEAHTARGNPGADYDQDGWVDFFVVVTDSNSSQLFRNRAADLVPSNRHLTIELVGDINGGGAQRSTRNAVGARVMVSADLDAGGSLSAGETQIREVVTGSGNAASTNSLPLEFGLGLATEATVAVLWPSGAHTVLTAVSDQKITIDEATQRGGPAQLLDNGSFEQGLNGWYMQLEDGGDALWTIDNGASTDGGSALRAEVLAVDGTNWHVQFLQGERPLIGGAAYRVRFDARTDTPSDINVLTGRDHDPWSGLGLHETVAIGTEWQSFELIFVAEDTDTDARLTFELGNQAERTLWFDNIHLDALDDTDSDADLVADSEDNCSVVANTDQRDTDADGYGNRCDPDLNNDGTIDFGDLNILKLRFFGDDADADLDGNGSVDFGDLNILKLMFFAEPGPGAIG